MSVAHLYEDFAPQRMVGGVDAAVAEKVADAKLQSFEDGYSAGWEDALEAQQSSAAQLSAALIEAAKDAALTRDEVFENFLTVTRPLLEAIVTKVVPSAARDALAAHILEIVDAHLNTVADAPINIAVHPSLEHGIAKTLAGKLPDNARITSAPDLTESQVIVSLAQDEHQIDLDRIIAEIQEAVAAFFHSAQKET